MIKLHPLILLFFLIDLTYGEVWVYPYPGKPVKKSPYYQVQVKQGNRNYDSFTYFSAATFKDLARSSSWTTFSFKGEVQVKVQCLQGDLETCEIRPTSKGITAEIKENSIRFTCNTPHQLALIINGDFKNPLFIFADGPEKQIPDKDDPTVWYFEPGVHDIGKANIAPNIKHVYIAGGAYIRGAFNSKQTRDDFKITGRGIVSGEVFPKVFNAQRKSTPDWRQRNPHNIELGGNGRDILVEGITISEGTRFGLVIRPAFATVQNCKFFGWYYNTDGVSCGPDGLVEDCFFRCNDDTIKVYRDRLVVRQCTIWQNDNGAPFQISWNSRGDYQDFHVYDSDVIYCEHHEDANNRAIFNSIHGGGGDLSNYLFENIRIEGDVFRLFKLTIQTSPSDGDAAFGSISNIRFRNISLTGRCLQANEIWGHNEEHKISNVSFENLHIQGQKILSAKQGNFKIDPETTNNISFTSIPRR